MLFLDLLPLMLRDARVPGKEIEIFDSSSSFLLNFFSYLEGLASKMAVYVDCGVGFEPKNESL